MSYAGVPGLIEQNVSHGETTLVVDPARLVSQIHARLDEPRHGVEAQEATLRSSYAGGTPAFTASWRRMIPSISCSGRGGQPGT